MGGKDWHKIESGTHDARSRARTNVQARTVKTYLLVGVAILVLATTLGLDNRAWLESAIAQESPVESPLEDPTPTPVPRTVNEIVHPQAGDAIAGETEIIGTAVITDFMRYEMHIGRAGEERWSWVMSSSEVVHDDVLHVLNTRGYADGRYDLRVRAVNMWGNYSEAFLRNVEIRNARPPTPTPDPNVTPVAVSPLPTPTPTPDMRARLPGGTGFYAPDYGAVLRGTVDVVAAIGGQYRNPVTRWDLAISPYGEEEWSVLRSGSEQGLDLTLMALDTTQYEDGLYDVRLRVSYEDGEFNDYFLRQLSFANSGEPQFAFMPRPGIIAPRDGETVADMLSVTATVPAADLMHWELAWSRQDSERWTLLTTGDRAMQEAELAQLDLSLLPSGLYDLRLRIVRRDREPVAYMVRGLQVQGLDDLPDEELMDEGFPQDDPANGESLNDATATPGTNTPGTDTQ